MSDISRRYFSADSLHRAVLLAASHYGLDPDRVAFREMELRGGGLKAGRKKVTIEVDPEKPERAKGEVAPRVEVSLPTPASRRPAPGGRPSGGGGRGGGGGERPGRGGLERGARSTGRSDDRRGRGEERRDGRSRSRDSRAGAPRPSAPRARTTTLINLPEVPRRLAERFPPALGPVADAARDAMERLVRVSGLRVEVGVLQGDGRLEIELSGRDSTLVTADGGELLSAFEYLVPKVARGAAEEGMPCRVDCDNFHEIREEQLRSLAQAAAEEVRQLGRPKVLEPMNPAERRIIHVTLEDDPGVETESLGEGFFKRVSVRPAGGHLREARESY